MKMSTTIPGRLACKPPFFIFETAALFRNKQPIMHMIGCYILFASIVFLCQLVFGLFDLETRGKQYSRPSLWVFDLHR